MENEIKERKLLWIEDVKNITNIFRKYDSYVFNEVVEKQLNEELNDYIESIANEVLDNNSKESDTEDYRFDRD